MALAQSSRVTYQVLVLSAGEWFPFGEEHLTYSGALDHMDRAKLLILGDDWKVEVLEEVA